jgi:hypothetical protein
MSEIIDNARRRKDLLKHMILQLHEGHAPDAVRPQLVRLLGQIPYGDVVEIEQELIAEGLPVSEVLKLCDVHTEALRGVISQDGARTAPAGHPVDIFQQENRALEWELGQIAGFAAEILALPEEADATETLSQIRGHVNALMDVNKHYQRKENLLFPFLEKHGISGPPTVMWGKHDETRAFLKDAIAALEAATEGATAGEAKSIASMVLAPATEAVSGMIDKEEQILFPMCMDTLTEAEWWVVARGSAEIGFCLVDPAETWRPENASDEVGEGEDGAGPRVQLPSGSLSVAELTAMLNTIPFDLTFVDKDDTVRFFTQGPERIFARTRAILGRQVQYCHPPSSVHIVERILNAFRSGEKSDAAFWIQMKGRFLHIEYRALRDGEGNYLGCLEISQDLTDKRALAGERRLLSWDEEGGADERPQA